jgi:RimJ/RimL family protein N-acetyltransferase
MKDSLLAGKQYYLRRLQKDDINERYLSWMNDPEVVKYLACGSGGQTIQSLIEYWQSKQNEYSYLLAIIDITNDMHIGNATVVCEQQGCSAELGMLIGEKDYWGKGCMYEVYGLLIGYAFGELGIKKVTLGAEGDNLPALITFRKLGFKFERTIKDSLFKNGRFIDVLRYVLSFDDYRAWKEKYG